MALTNEEWSAWRDAILAGATAKAADAEMHRVKLCSIVSFDFDTEGMDFDTEGMEFVHPYVDPFLGGYASMCRMMNNGCGAPVIETVGAMVKAMWFVTGVDMPSPLTESTEEFCPTSVVVTHRVLGLEEAVHRVLNKCIEHLRGDFERAIAHRFAVSYATTLTLDELRGEILKWRTWHERASARVHAVGGLPRGIVLDVMEKLFHETLLAHLHPTTVRIATEVERVTTRQNDLAANLQHERNLVRKYAMRTLASRRTIEELTLAASVASVLSDSRRHLAGIAVEEKAMADAIAQRDKHLVTIKSVRDRLDSSKEALVAWMVTVVNEHKKLWGDMAMTKASCGCLVPVCCLPIHEDTDNQMMPSRPDIDPHGWLIGCAARAVGADWASLVERPSLSHDHGGAAASGGAGTCS